ncbi:aldo/keto reductase [Leucobacter aridicollis]|uniref:aldo/keto reductase n=1 Tax=Leucobacter aridicollis TaxID=283878 RepID=UPI0021081436|nr:aldo/keto reductase [Leucobacter aridicollis]UTX53787.1 aldo/keto reductase [Leucobacter aridicollis]
MGTHTGSVGTAHAETGSQARGVTQGEREIELAGHRVSRVGFGAARLTAGDGWGEPADPAAAKDLLLAAVEAGFTYVDTADALGPGVSERLIGEALGNRDDVLVATKVGMLRPAADAWGVLGRPDYLRQQIHLSLQRLRRDRIDLLYLHRIDPAVPLADQLGVLQEARDRGDVGAIGVSEPSAAQLDEVLTLEPSLAAVQSLLSVVARQNGELAARLDRLGIPFVAYWPLVGRGLKSEQKALLFAELGRIGDTVGLSAHQLSLAWIFSVYPHAAAVAGSRSLIHLVQNQQAAGVRLDSCVVSEVEAAVAAIVGDTPFDPRFPKEHA